jgi:hypothetical protein
MEEGMKEPYTERPAGLHLGGARLMLLPAK